MSNLSETAVEAVQAEESAAVFLNLLKIEVEGFDPLYFVDNTEAVTSNGIVYNPCGFNVVLPAQNDDGTSKSCRLEVDNVDRAISQAVISAANKQIICTISIIIAQTPDVIERGPIRMILRNVSITKSTVSGELYDFYIYDRKIPEGVYNPQDFPGLF